MPKPIKRNRPGLVFSETVTQRMAIGINTLVNAIAPTLGPHPRSVAFLEGLNGEVEMLDKGGLIARRIVALPERSADVGAMLLRQVLWDLHQDMGDGTATSAVVFQAVLNGGLRYLAAGGNAQLLRSALEEGLRLILDCLDEQTRPLTSAEELHFLARTASHDPSLASDLASIFEVIGEFGRLELRKGQRHNNELAFQAGSYWDSGAMSTEFVASTRRAMLGNVALLLSDLEINEPSQLIPVLAAAIDSGCDSLLILANKIDERALSVLHSTRERAQIAVYAVSTPATGDEQVAALNDLCVLTGGRPFLRAAGDSLHHVTMADLGHARHAWVDARTFGVMGGQGDPCALMDTVEALTIAYRQASKSSDRRKLQGRLARLYGGTATLWIGGLTEQNIEARTALAQNTESALRAALGSGIVPGGGAALLACQPVLKGMAASIDQPERRAAATILHSALESPLRCIVSNAGYDPSTVIASIRHTRSMNAFDAARGLCVNALQDGLIDVAEVTKRAISAAVQGAALALTIEAIVHHREPELVYQP